MKKKRKLELDKLDGIDAGVAQWISKNDPEGLSDFINYLTQCYEQVGIKINGKKLTDELREVH